MFVSEIKNELINHIAPFWGNLRDHENGGFYGFMDSDLNLDKAADKGVILHARILWFYSNCFLVLKELKYLDMARHAYLFLTNYCVDKENGGVFWSVDFKGKPVDTMKHIYCQAFFVYALASYFDASGDKEALGLAYEAFDVIESRGRDDISYLEAMTADWKPTKNEALSENGIDAEKTMNTILHLIEAYTELLRVDGNKRVRERLEFLLNFTYEKIFDEKENKLFVFFDNEMKVLGDIHSYGHDIEATWLLDRACDVICDEQLSKKIASMNKKIVDKISSCAIENGVLNNERDGSEINKKRVWWVEAEGVVGFVNAYQRYNEAKHLETAKSLWDYINNCLVDKRENGEWHSEINADGINPNKPVVEPWKCPYHNGRMCLEIISRNVIV